MLKILQFLKSNACEDDRRSWIRTIKVHDDVYGVKLSKINPLISQWSKEARFEDIKSLWEDGKVESRIIAAKLLGRLGKKDPDRALELIRAMVKDLRDWPTTDTLATQGIRGILKNKSSEIKSLAMECLDSDNPWTKRFGIVVFINFPESNEAIEVLKRFKGCKEYYIRKAVEWLERKIS